MEHSNQNQDAHGTLNLNPIANFLLPDDNRRLHGEQTEAEARADIVAALGPAALFGFLPEKLNMQELYEMGYMPKSFKKTIAILKNVRTEAMADAIFEEAIRDGKLQRTKDITLDVIINLAKWMRGQSGGKALQLVQKRLKLEKKRKVAANLTREDALMQALMAQKADLSAEEKEVRIRYGESISAIQRQIRDLERAEEAAIAAIKARFAPASEYVRQNDEDFVLKCYQRYVEVAAERGELILPRGEAGYQKATELYGDDIRTAHLLEFLNQPRNRELLLQYARRA